MAKKRSTQPVAASNTYCPTLIEFVLDETGSMSSHLGATISGFNSFVDEQRAAGGQCLLTLTKFDTSGFRTPYVDTDVNLVPHLNSNTFVPNLGTNLRDALGQRVRELEARLATWTIKPQVLFVVLTDGDDNASSAYSVPQIRDLIAAHEFLGWTFVYLGSDARALEAAKAMGFQAGNTKQFENSQMHQTMETLAQATTVFRATAATASSKSFFG